MYTQFRIRSSDPTLLVKATRIADEFAKQYICDEVVGIVLLGAVVRGYFDKSADIDIAIFKKQGTTISIDKKFYTIEGIEVQVWLSDYESELTTDWDMSRRWTYSRSKIYYDPQGKITQLLVEKVPLKPEERQWLLMSNFVLSEWYFNRLTQLWVERGNLKSAHHMFDQGLNYFFEMLFALNNQLSADMKWRYYCTEQLERVPTHYQERIKSIMLLNSFSLEELERRRSAFMEMWREMLPIVEKELDKTLDEMLQLV